MRIEARGLAKSYVQSHSGTGIVAIDNIDLDIDAGEVVAIVGKTGCGKSTFFNMLLGLERPSAGTLRVDGRSPSDDFLSFRGQMGVVFQRDRLIPWRTALENVELGLEVVGCRQPERRERARQWLQTMGLDAFSNAYPRELSGGMRQRVSMARAFSVRPRLILADESFGHLDEVTAEQLRKEFIKLVHDSQATAVFITHQLEEAINVPERVIVFGRPGRVLMEMSVGSLNTAEKTDARNHIQQCIANN